VGSSSLRRADKIKRRGLDCYDRILVWWGRLGLKQPEGVLPWERRPTQQVADCDWPGGAKSGCLRPFLGVIFGVDPWR